MAENINLYH